MQNNLSLRGLLSLFLLLGSISWGQSEFYHQQQQVFSSASKCIAQLPDSGYFVAGDYYSGSNYPQTFTRLNKFGAVVWSKKAVLGTGLFSNAVIHTSANKLVTCGRTGTGFTLLFMDENGNSLSNRQFSYNTSFNESFRGALAETPDKKVYALAPNHLVKTDSVGNVIWQKRFSANSLNLSEVHAISSSKLILTGFATDVQAINSGYDIVQICIDSSGAVLWSKSFGTRTMERMMSSVYANGKIYHIGSMGDLSNRSGSAIFCTDTNGTQLWCKWVDVTRSNYQPVALGDGSIAVKSILNGDMYLTRYSGDGDFISGIFVDFPSGFQSLPAGIVATNDGGVYLEMNNYNNNSRNGLKLSSDLYPGCIAVVPFTPDTLFNQVLEEMPLVLGVSNYTTSTVLNPAYSNVAFVNVPLCNSNCEAVAAFTPDKTHLCQGETATFADHSQNAVSYQWWLNSSIAGTGASFSQTFSAPGVYRVKLVVSNGICADSTSSHITVTTPLPAPVFTVETDHFKGWFNTAVPQYSSVSWTFGDGTGTQHHIDSLVHNFKSGGTYEVCLSETNVCGTVSDCQDITLHIDSTYQFIKHYNEDSFYNGRRWGDGALALAGGDYLLSGTDDTWQSTGWEGTLIKTDKKGTPKWTQIISVPVDDAFKISRMAETYRGYILFGASNGASPFLGIMDSSGAYTIMLRLSTASSGAFLTKPYENPDGNIIFTGSYGAQAFAAKTDPALGIHWFKRHNALRMVYGSAKIPGGFVLVGTDVTNTQAGIMKLDENGDYISSYYVNFTGNTPSAARDIILLSDGNYLISGSINNGLFLMKTDTEGNVLWSKKYTDSGGATVGAGTSVTEDGSGSLSVVTSRGIVIKTDASGNLIWAWDPPGSFQYGAVRHSKSLDGGLIIAATQYGYFDSVEEEMSMYKLDPSGNAPSCWGNLITLISSSLTANVSPGFNTVTSGAPSFTRIFSNNPYASLQAEICAAAEPLLNAGFTQNGACAGASVQFSDISSGMVSSHSWSFTGGMPAASSDINPSVVWDLPGTYAVTLTVTDANGNTSTQSQNVIVASAPVVDAGTDLSACSGTAVTLNGSGSGTLYWNPSSALADPSDPLTSATPLSSGIFVLNAVLGSCSATDTVSVTVFQEYSDTVLADICNGESYEFEGNTYSAPGIYSSTFQTVQGCDSIVTLHLIVSAPDPAVSVSGITLTANSPGAAYAWISCDDGVLVGNAQSFTPTEAGNYAVIVTENSCSDTSDCYAITAAGIGEPSAGDWLIYPVPSDDMVYIVTAMEIEGEPYHLYDNAGRVVLEGKLASQKTAIPLSDLSTGVYRLKAGTAGYSFKVIRK